MRKWCAQMMFVVVACAFGLAQGLSSDAIPVIPGVNVSITGDRTQVRIAKEVRHELAMLPRYGLFDDLRFRIKGDDTVELLGDVVHASLKSDAENAIKKIEGVEHVVNNINIIPPSSSDDQVRLAVARAIAGSGGLSRYFWEAAPSIHVIVSRGRVTLTGVVDSAADSQQAQIVASGVPGSFGVTNNLVVANNSVK